MATRATQVSSPYKLFLEFQSVEGLVENVTENCTAFKVCGALPLLKKLPGLNKCCIDSPPPAYKRTISAVFSIGTVNNFDIIRIILYFLKNKLWSQCFTTET